MRTGSSVRAFVALVGSLSVLAAARAGVTNAVSAASATTNAAALPAARAARELGVAKAALRDGLWLVARTHAARVPTDEARLVTLESFASEGRWDEVSRALAAWPAAKGASFDYYRAASAGNRAAAAAALRALGDRAGRASAAMFEAEALFRAGDRAGAEKLWRGVVADTNAEARAVAIAAANLGDAAVLRRVYARELSDAERRMVGFRLGRALLTDAATREEGAALVRRLAKETPDAPEACASFAAVAAAQCAASRWMEAVAIYHDLLEIWPEAAKDAAVQEGRGEAFFNTGRRDEARAAFARAEELASDDAARAHAAVRQADLIASAGDAEAAKNAYRRVVERYPQTAVAGRVRARLALEAREEAAREAFRAGRYAEARAAFAKVAAEDATRAARLGFCEALCLYGLGREDEAAERARELSRECHETDVRAAATLWLAKLSYNRARWKEASELFAIYADGFADRPEALSALVWSARAALAANDAEQAIARAARAVERAAVSPQRVEALVLEGEALIALARFDEAALVLEGAAAAPEAREQDRTRARTLRADALFALGADNPVRYEGALEAYRALIFGGTLDADRRLAVSFKIARTLEKLKRVDEAMDAYYADVVLAYREGRSRGERYGDEARAAFSRAAFRLADENESRGKGDVAANVLGLVATSDVPAAAEARRRLEKRRR